MRYMRPKIRRTLPERSKGDAAMWRMPQLQPLALLQLRDGIGLGHCAIAGAHPKERGSSSTADARQRRP